MKTALAITQTLSRRYYPLHPEEQEALASIMECRRVDKRELVLEEGRIARHFHYVESGMLRQYYYKNGHDITEHFQNKADSWRFETAKERYKRFLKDFPEAAKRVPISHIASYLLMTPETLSRVRAEIFQE